MIRHKSAYTSGVYARMGNIIYPLDKDLYDTSMFYCYTESQYTYIIDFQSVNLISCLSLAKS
ncbi:rIIA protector from prophage-induced early lysis [Klebsiella phage CPRSB]|nr:rIIA protector from prophage-induced early lysis [Klebsiella phage CPRSB]